MVFKDLQIDMDTAVTIAIPLHGIHFSFIIFIKNSERRLINCKLY